MVRAIRGLALELGAWRCKHPIVGSKSVWSVSDTIFDAPFLISWDSNKLGGYAASIQGSRPRRRSPAAFGYGFWGQLNDKDRGGWHDVWSPAPAMVKSREGADCCSGDGTGGRCVGGGSGGRDSSEPAISLAPAPSWRTAVCLVNSRGPARPCAAHHAADATGRP